MRVSHAPSPQPKPLAVWPESVTREITLTSGRTNKIPFTVSPRMYPSQCGPWNMP